MQGGLEGLDGSAGIVLQQGGLSELDVNNKRGRRESGTNLGEVVLGQKPIQVALTIELRATVRRQGEDLLESSVYERIVRRGDADRCEGRDSLEVGRVGGDAGRGGGERKRQ